MAQKTLAIWEALPQDLIDDILLRLPVKSIGRLRCVSKQWKSDLSTARFALAHLKYLKTTDPENLFCIDHHFLYVFSLGPEGGVFRKIESSLKEEVAIIKWIIVGGSCHGMVLLRVGTFDEYGIFLMNPINLEYERVHDSVGYSKEPSYGLDYRFAAHGLGYDESKDDYKIVSLIVKPAGKHTEQHGRGGSVEVDIYSFKTKTWKRTSVQNCLDYHKILSFNLAREEFQVVPLPCAIVRDFKLAHEELQFERLGSVDIRVLRECLAVIVPMNFDTIHVWVMREYGVRDSWTKLTFPCPGLFYSYDSVFLLNDHEILLKRYSTRIFLVSDSRKGILKDLAVVGVPDSVERAHDRELVLTAFRWSLVSPNNLS